MRRNAIFGMALGLIACGVLLGSVPAWTQNLNGYRWQGGTAVQQGTADDDETERDRCVSNLKGLGLAALLYSADHDGKLPDAGKWADQLLPYLTGDTLFKCPSAPGLEYGYAMNAALSGVDVEEQPDPAGTVLFFDSHLGTRNAADGWEAVCHPGRHGGGNCYAYVDGHAKWLAEVPDLNPEGMGSTTGETATVEDVSQSAGAPTVEENVLTEGDVLKTLTGKPWTRLDPGEDAEWTDDEAPLAIAIGAPPGNHLHRSRNYDAPRQTVRVNGDFEMQALVETNPQWATQEAGLLTFGPQRSQVRLGRVCVKDEQLVMLLAYDSAGEYLGGKSIKCTAKTLRLSLRRSGNDFHGWFRLAGADNWTYMGKVSVPMPAESQPGIGLINDPGSEWFEARFSAFQIKVGAQIP